MENKPTMPQFTSSLVNKERLAVLGYFPIHLILLPVMAAYLAEKELLSVASANLMVYAVGMVYMLVVGLRFLRREFDALCDYPGVCIRSVFGAYVWMWIANYGGSDLIMTIMNVRTGGQGFTPLQAVAVIMMFLPFFQGLIRRGLEKLYLRRRMIGSLANVTGIVLIYVAAENLTADILIRSTDAAFANPNNEAIIATAGMDYGTMAGMAVFMAPVVEEFLFRAGLFGTLVKKNRFAAYAVTIICFSMFHIYPYLQADPGNLVYVLQYIPISFLLCRVYEKTNSVWSSIFLHMLVNGISMKIISALGALL